MASGYNLHDLLRRRRKRRRRVSPFRLWAVSITLLAITYLGCLAFFLSRFGGPRQHNTDGFANTTTSSSTNSITYISNDGSARLFQPKSANDPDRNHRWIFDRGLAEQRLQQLGSRKIRKIITAYMEPPLNDTIPGTGNQGAINDEKDFGIPPDFYQPLPLRTITPEQLTRIEYPKFQTCHDLPAKLPVDRGLQFDPDSGDVLITNVGDVPYPPNFARDEAKYCPVEADPFLPWIHDLFPSHDGRMIHFIAQNKRRCRTGKKFRDDLKRLQPQVALLQSVSVQRISESTARRMAPELWYPPNEVNSAARITTTTTTTTTTASSLPRYRLVPYEEAAKDGMATRFLCRFHTTNWTDLSSLVIGESLSVYPFPYEYIAFRKGQLFPHLLTPKGKDNRNFWTSTLFFSCPVPTSLQHNLQKENYFVLKDGTPTIHLDIIPIRTSPRFGAWHHNEWKSRFYLHPDWVGQDYADTGFNATQTWGIRHVLPRVEASGRWTNLPICPPLRPSGAVEDNPTPRQRQPDLPTTITTTASGKKTKVKNSETTDMTKQHVISICLWASASFRTRGVKKGPTKDTLARLQEWMEFHFLVGVDHIYVYDNSGAHTNETSLESLTSQYPSTMVTRIDWPSLICNNNIPGTQKKKMR